MYHLTSSPCYCQGPEDRHCHLDYPAPDYAYLCCPYATFHRNVYPYEVFALRISESPASRIAIVEHRNSFPHAVPSSICTPQARSAKCDPPQPIPLERLLLRAREETLQSREAPSLGSHIFPQGEGGLRCCRRSGVQPSSRACCSLHRFS